MPEIIIWYIKKYWNNRTSFWMLATLTLIWIVSYFSMLIPFIHNVLKSLQIDWFSSETALRIKYSILWVGILFIFVLWLYWRKFPKFKYDDVGILFVSNPGHSPILNEIIDNLRVELEWKLGKESKLVMLKSAYHYKKMIDLHAIISTKKDEATIAKFQEETRTSYVIIFESWVRDNGTLIEIKNIQQIVFHRPTHQQNSDLLRRDLMFVLWQNLDISTNAERETIREFTNNLSPCIRYISSVIDFLGWKDFKSCRDRLENILESGALNEMHTKNKNILINKINLLLSKTYEEEVNMIIYWFHASWFYPTDRLQELLLFNEKWCSYFGSYELKLQRAIIYFLIDFRTEKARKIIKSAQWYSGENQSWRASLVFLDLYDWEYKKAFENIRKIKKYKLDFGTGRSIEIFNNGILINKPEKNILYFWNAVVSKLFLKDLKKFKSYKELFIKESEQEDAKYFLSHF